MHNDNPLYKLFSLIQLHTIDWHEISTLAQLHNIYQQLTRTEEKPVKLQLIDLKNTLKGTFEQKLKFLKPTHFSLTNSSEFVMLSQDSVLPNRLLKFLLGGVIQKSLPI